VTRATAEKAPGEASDKALARLLEGLNPPQREAVTHGEGPLLILAGAGSGKTRALTYRIAYLIATGKARPGEILAITFTNKAAGEMKERVERLVGAVSRLMWVMTFHSACARILRREAERLGYARSFTIYDEADSLRMVKRCQEELEVDTKRFNPRAVKAQISGAKNRLLDSSGYREQMSGFFEQTVADVYTLYEKRMHEANAMDFDDLLANTVSLLELFEDVRDRYRRTFRHVLVDEYQDTNRAQYRLLQLLTGEERNLFVIGDDYQAVYGFRGADIRNILEFQDDFPDARVIKLEQNYRSTQTILSAANAVVANNRGQISKSLWTELGEGDRVHVVELADEHEEARYVAGELERLVDEEGLSRDEIAVFYRTNAQSRVLEDTMVRFNLPYQVIGGTKFYERAEIKDAVAYLSLLVNPADAVSFARVVNSPRRGIGQTSQARLLSYANTTGLPIWDVAVDPAAVPGLGAAAVKSVGRFMSAMEGLRDRVATSSVGDLLEALLHETGYVEALESERTIEAEGRLENLQELVGVAREFDQNYELASRERSARSAQDEADDVPPLAQFLEQISLYSEQDALRDERGLATLMTLHNAKGLEYDCVFMIGCEEGVFPHSRSVEEGNLEEERRLCYVGMTRARQRLYISYAKQRTLFGARDWNMPSRFIDEVPDELVERTETEQSGSGGWSFGGNAGAGTLGSPAERSREAGLISFVTGDDIVHATFGEGVVTSVEPGGVVTVRFGDGSERKLMAEYAPMRKA
jgi:DNA helicase II / ATP-dependent DNA helicase PcrA